MHGGRNPEEEGPDGEPGSLGCEAEDSLGTGVARGGLWGQGSRQSAPGHANEPATGTVLRRVAGLESRFQLQPAPGAVYQGPGGDLQSVVQYNHNSATM